VLLHASVIVIVPLFVLVLVALCLKRDVRAALKIPFCIFTFETKIVAQGNPSPPAPANVKREELAD